MKKVIAVLLALGLVLTLAGCIRMSSGEEVIVKIPEGSGAYAIGEILEEKGIVRNATLFYRWSQVKGDAEAFQYGTYMMNPGMSYEEIAAVLKEGTIAEGVLITVLPGQSVESIGTMLEEKGLCTKEEFITACDSATYDYAFITDMPDKELRRHILEGYLAAESIEVLLTDDAYAIAERLLAQTQKVLESRTERLQELGMTVDELMVLASVVEKEADNTEDMKRVARVFLNRNAIGMAWESCPTVWYALEQESEATLTLLYSQIEQASYPNCRYYRYNTYTMYQSEAQGEKVYKPIGPICSPGADAIDAVLYPADESDKALYFSYNFETGQTDFFDDYESFYNANYK